MSAVSPRRVAVFLLATIAPTGFAAAETLRIVPSVSVTETYSDNLDLAPRGVAKSGWITDLAPGIRLDLNGARAKGFLDFRYNDVSYNGESQFDNSRKQLNSRFTLEAVERFLFLEARADTTQENRSPFGTAATADQSTLNRNRVETNTIQFAPILRGRIADAASYVLRYNVADVRIDDSLFPDTRTGEFSARFQSEKAARINWIVEGRDIAIRNDVIGTLRDTWSRATLAYEPVPHLQFSASGGYERSDFTGSGTQNRATGGLGLAWNPSARTQFSAVGERRYFGAGHSLHFSHRMPGAAFRISSVKDAEMLPSGLANSQSGSIAGLVDFLLTSAIPEPEARATAARRRMEEFAIGGNSILSSGLASFRPYVYRNSVASAALLGTRHAVTITLTDREQRYADIGALAGALPQADDNRQRGYAVSVARRFTPLTTVTLFGRSLRTDGIEATAPDTRQADYGVAVTSRLNRNTTCTLGARRVSFDTTAPDLSYREGAVFLTVSLRT